MEELRDGVINSLRSFLISVKGGCKIEDLNRDYKTVVDENIPYRKLGFSNLYDFLLSIPSIKVFKKGADYYVDAVPTKESEHLARLVAQQKTVSKKSRKKGVFPRRLAPSRQPYRTNRYNSTPRNGNHNSATGRQNMPAPVPLMSMRAANMYSKERPRFIHAAISGEAPRSPSNKMLERQNGNTAIPKNQSITKPRDDSYLKNNEKNVIPVINQKPKTVDINTEYPVRQKMDISKRLIANRNISSTTNLPSSIQVPSSVSTVVLSPLSPAQLLSGGHHIKQSQNPPSNLSAIENSKRTVTMVPVKSDDPREELLVRANTLNLSTPVYQILPTKMRNTNEPAIYAQVKIGPYGYASYPEEARTETEAQKIAAKIALAGLTEKYGSSTLSKTVNTVLIKEKVLEIVDSHSNGIFMHEVPTYYKQKYREILPQNWQEIIKECPAIVLEKGVDNSIILRRFVLSANKSYEEAIVLKLDKVQLNPIGPAVPEQLQLPDQDFWMIIVTCVISSNEIWVRLFENADSEQFENMTTELMHHYKKVQTLIKPSAIEIGKYYAIFENDSWHRVRCMDFNTESGLATVFFIDIGDEDTYEYNKLQILDKKFCLLPAQGFRLSLAGLHDFSDCESALIYIEKLLLDRAFYVEVINREVSEDYIPSVSVVFYDTSGPEDINLNTAMLKHIVKEVLTGPSLKTEGQVDEVFVSHVDQNGDIYVQVQSESMKILVNLLNRLIATGPTTEDLKNSFVMAIDTDKIYFVMVDGNWYRGKVISYCSNDELRVFLVDFGKTVSTKRTSFLSLEKLSEILTIYPPQALKVHLHNIDKSMFNEKMAAQLSELAPKEEPLLVKVVSTKDSVPEVELFKRIQPSNMLVSINHTLALDEHRRSQDDRNNNGKTRKRGDRLNSKSSINESDEAVKSLKPPKISTLGGYLDVHVTMAAHPGNFTVQPFADQSSLEKMMIQLQDACCSYTGPPPSPESVKKGKLYAAKHIDGHWYRVCVTSIIKEGMVSVYFCDFGDASVLSLFNLQPLKSQFLELPYQAIKARLVGIRPVNVDWSVEDSVRFQELVVQKNFVSIVIETEVDELSPGDTVLGLKLIDVNTSDDVYIDQLLVNEGRAAHVDKK